MMSMMDGMMRDGWDEYGHTYTSDARHGTMPGCPLRIRHHDMMDNMMMMMDNMMMMMDGMMR